MSTSVKMLRRLLVAALASTAPVGAVMTLSTPAALAQAQAGEDIDLEVFYRELQPYGEWFRHERWGEVWRPNVDANWRPYTRGHWARTEDHGWMWVAEEEWGWAVFHYGRWVFDEDEDFWIWIPGSQWAPAWVQWRESEDQVGWAPLPPDSYLDDGVMRFNASAYDGSRFSRYWVVVPPRYMFEPGLYRHVSPVSRQTTFFRSTRPVTVHHHMYRGNVYHPGPDWRRVERWAGRSVPLVTLRTVTTSRDQGWRRSGSSPSVLPIYRPRVVVAPDRTRASLPNVNPRPERDWRRGDGRDGRPDGRWGSFGRPSDDRRPDARPGSGGWQPGGRPQPSVTVEPSRSDRRPEVRTEPPGGSGSGRPDRRPNVQTEPTRPTGPTAQPTGGGRPPQPEVRSAPAPTGVLVPTPWSPPARGQPPAVQPGAQPLGRPAVTPGFRGPAEIQSNDK